MEFMLKEEIDFYVEFKDWYFKILKDFKFNYDKDCQARDILSEIIKEKSKDWILHDILDLFKNSINKAQNILIYGCGPSLEHTVDYILKKNGMEFFNNSINFAADGASVYLREKKIHINGLFTDLDGITKKEFDSEIVDFILVHAHGDNIDNLEFFKDDILKFKNIIGTTQVEPLDNLVNPGGFTDGDRILFFIKNMLEPNHNLLLIGMDFGDLVGKYSKPHINENQKGSQVKQKKLQYAVQLLEWISDKICNKIYFLNSEIVSDKFHYLSLKNFEKLTPS